MIYEFRNALTGLFEFVDTEASAITRLAEIRADYLKQESDRFSIVKVIAVGDDSMWSIADLDNDPEDCNYKMFIHTTGQYESFLSLSSSKARRQELIDNFMAQFETNEYKMVEAPTAQPSQPNIGYPMIQPITTIKDF